MKTIALIALLCAVVTVKSANYKGSLCNGRENGDRFNNNPHDPSSFIQCSNGRAIDLRCPSHLVFNNDLMVCDFKPVTSTTTTTTTTPTTTTNTTTPTTTTTTTTPPPEKCPDSLCKWQPNGALFRLSDDHPSYYVQCSNHQAVCRECPAGLVFSNDLDVCVRPANKW